MPPDSSGARDSVSEQTRRYGTKHLSRQNRDGRRGRFCARCPRLVFGFATAPGIAFPYALGTLGRQCKLAHEFEFSSGTLFSGSLKATYNGRAVWSEA